MTCLKPIKLRNPTLRIAKCGGTPLYIEVPCGKCAECKKTKRMEWNFRTYHQVTDCVFHGGYVYFDTLTYADEHLPHLSDFLNIKGKNIDDFSCFCCEHWRKFLKLLRIRLHRAYGAILKYFITSEYGCDERYTHRPHYHLLLFVYPGLGRDIIKPYDLSLLVSSCWPYGRTDGLPYQSEAYVKEHIYGYNLGQQHALDFLPVCAYVSKYITKDSTFQKQLDKRVEVLRKHFDDDTLAPILRNIDMFHRQSQGFGLSYLENLTYDEFQYIFEHSACRIVDESKVVTTISLPLYYKRKLFYDFIKRDDKYIWQPNKKGCEFIRKKMLSMVSFICSDIYARTYQLSDDDKRYISSLLNGRTIEDFAIYKLFYKGRYKVDITRTADYEANLYDWIERIVRSLSPYKLDAYNVLSVDKDNDAITFVSQCYLDGSLDYQSFNYSNYVKSHVFNQNSVPCFSRFDELDAFLKSLSSDLNRSKQLKFDYIEVLQKKFKVLYGHT